MKASLEVAIKLGELLFRQKELIMHGAFGVWIKKNLPIKERTAQRYMQLYLFKDQLEKNSIETITDAYYAIDGKPLQDEILCSDESTLTKQAPAISMVYSDVDNIELPRRKPEGLKKKIRLCKSVVDEMKKEKSYYSHFKGHCLKFVVETPQKINDPAIYGEFVQLANNFLQEGGKIIFVKKP